MTKQAGYLDEFANFLVSEPSAAAKLLAQHVDDGRGYCRVFTVGAQHGNHHWPCNIYNAVTMAMAAEPASTRP